MKKMALVFALVVMTSTTLFAGEVVKLAIGDWAPYTSETDQKGKLLEKVVTEAFKLEGIDVKYDYFPWKRSYIYVEQGKYDGTFPWNKTEEREKEFYIHKISLINDEGVYFHLINKQFDWNTIDDLKKYKVGVTIGYKQEELYKSKGITAESVPNEEQNFKKMLAGRIDVYQTSKVVGYSAISKLFSPEDASMFTNHPKPVEESQYYILFSKTTPKGKELADKLDSGLKKLKDSGSYDKILAEYNIK
ncbi:MAG: transporter substrate-binding domain-containing protein [Desulfamplus sp.]|nr:transporter substrate-binding domain-containing protein [Desulfamplus sp.]